MSAMRGWENVTRADLGMRSFPKQPQKPTTMPKARRSKFGAVKTVIHGWTFDSKREATRYEELLARGASGEIRNLELQPRFPVVLKQAFFEIPICVYKADFRYEEKKPRGPADWHDVWCDRIEDVKGVKTSTYRLKKKLVEALYAVKILEIR